MTGPGKYLARAVIAVASLLLAGCTISGTRDNAAALERDRCLWNIPHAIFAPTRNTTAPNVGGKQLPSPLFNIITADPSVRVFDLGTSISIPKSEKSFNENAEIQTFNLGGDFSECEYKDNFINYSIWKPTLRALSLNNREEAHIKEIGIFRSHRSFVGYFLNEPKLQVSGVYQHLTESQFHQLLKKVSDHYKDTQDRKIYLITGILYSMEFSHLIPENIVETYKIRDRAEMERVLRDNGRRRTVYHIRSLTFPEPTPIAVSVIEVSDIRQSGSYFKAGQFGPGTIPMDFFRYELMTGQ
ncbi:MAG: hypothetical protein VX464_18880 [Pseudomonadota bacterium]|nr:hypothetical protein [Pseudomonadota bacterium]